MFFLIDESFTVSKIRHLPSTMEIEEHMLHLLHGDGLEGSLEECMRSHPCLSWSVLTSTLLKTNKKDAAKYILQNHDFHVKGYL